MTRYKRWAVGDRVTGWRGRGPNDPDVRERRSGVVIDSSDDGEMTLVLFDDGGLTEWHPATRLSPECSTCTEALDDYERAEMMGAKR